MIDVKWLATCATAGEFLYGQYTASALKKMYESKKGCTISMENLIAAAQELEKSGEILMEYCGGKLEDHDDDFGFFAPKECEGTALEKVMRQADAEGNPYASLHFDDEERTSLMLDTPSDLEYYIPTEKEIKELVENGYIRTPAMTRLEEQIRQKGGDPAFLIPLWAQISTDKQEAMEAIKSILSSAFPAHQQRTAKQQPSEQMGASKGEKQQVTAEKSSHPFAVNNLNSLMPYVNEFINSVNLRVRRGWRPKELSRKTYPHGLSRMPTISPGSAHMAKLMKEAEPQLRAMGVQTDYSSIDNLITVGQHGERRVLKVGRNDPCPCGSGKKYKKCHGRMKG